MNAVLPALIDKTCCMAIIIIARIVFRIIRNADTGLISLIRANPAARDVRLHIVVVEGQLIRKLCNQTDAAFLPLANPPVSP